MNRDVKVLPELGEVEFDFSDAVVQSKLTIVRNALTNVRVIKIISREDDRGFLLKDIQSSELPKDNEGKPMFGEHYNVFNPEPMIRGFHVHRELWDYFCIVTGKAKFVIFDARKVIGGKPNPTYKQGNEYVFSDRNPGVLVVPPGVFHGWKSYVPNTLMSSTGSHLYDPNKLDEVRVPYKSFGYNWEVEIK